jgi:hypothetical protein
MISARLLRWTGGAAAASALVLVTGLAPAAGATPGTTAPGWRVFRTVGANPNYTYPQPQGASSFATTGKRDAWSVFQTNGGKFLVLHWNGSAWKNVPPGPGLTAPVAIGASSSSNVWLFNAGAHKTRALHWNGSAWTNRTIPSWVITKGLALNSATTAVNFGHGDVWVFNSSAPSAALVKYAARYNGHTWTKSHLPAVAETWTVNAVSRNDIWAVGERPSLPSVLMHWNGKAWHTLAVPKVAIPAGTTETVGDLAATGPHSLWLEQGVQWPHGAQYAQSLLHWTGKTWQRVHLHYPTSGVSAMTRDGHGGVWLIATGKAPAYTQYLEHLNAGHWTRRLAPTARGAKLRQLFGIIRVPGSTSVWATGTLDLPGSANGSVGGIWKYGA